MADNLNSPSPLRAREAQGSASFSKNRNRRGIWPLQLKLTCFIGVSLSCGGASAYGVDRASHRPLMGLSREGYKGSSVERQPQGEQAKVHYLFVPVGFDDNDDVEVVIDGYLPNSCYKVLDPVVTFDETRATFRVEPRTRYQEIPHVPCLEALVPYHRIVKLGVMPVGEYAVVVKQSSLETSASLIETLVVERASTSTQDRDLYAPVDSAQVQRDSRGRQYVEIQGRLTNSCMELGELILQDHGPTLNLLPRLNIRSPTLDAPCQSRETFYSRKIYLPTTLTSGRHLIHVRSLNGTALNVLFYVRPWD